MVRLNHYLISLFVGLFVLSSCVPAAVPVPVFVIQEPATTETGATVLSTSMSTLTTAPLLTVLINLDEPRDIGSGQMGIRYVSDFTGGAAIGNRLQAQVLSDGQNWYLIRNDRIAELVIQGMLQTEDGAQIAFRSRAFATAPFVTLEEQYKASLIDPTNWCFRGVTFFATNHPDYVWLNLIETISIYHYDLYQVQIVVYTIG